jgi:imidazolonepropionase
MESGFAQGRLLIKDIGHLVGFGPAPIQRLEGSEMRSLPVIEDAWLAIEDGRVIDGGSMVDFPGIVDWNQLEVLDATGRVVLPSWVDSHTHLVHASSREGEFVDRIRGLSYQEIAARGGGILNSAKVLREMSEDDLFDVSLARMERLMTMGTGAIEIKSGYGCCGWLVDWGRWIKSQSRPHSWVVMLCPTRGTVRHHIPDIWWKRYCRL